jgi:tetratricopeptide (TPR) repeat protein
MQQAQVQFERDSFNLALVAPGQGGMGFVGIIEEYGSTKAGNLANYYAAVSYLNIGKYEAALDYAKSFDADGSLLPAMKYGIIGDAESELNNMDAALTAYRSAVDAAGDNFVTGGYYLNKLGLLLRSQGKNEEALKAFRRLKVEYGQSPEAATADKYITMLETAQ